MNALRLTILAITLWISAVGVGACLGSDETAAPTNAVVATSRPQDAAVTGTELLPEDPASLPPGLHPLDTRSGVEAVDRLLGLVKSGDAEAITHLFEYSAVACRDDGLQGPPCPDGSPAGTLIEALPATCGSFLSNTQAVRVVEGWLVERRYLYAVFEPFPNTNPGGVDVSLAVALASDLHTAPSAIYLLAGDGSIVAVDGCSSAPDETSRRAAQFLVAPLDPGPARAPEDELAIEAAVTARLARDSLLVAIGVNDPGADAGGVVVFGDYVQDALGNHCDGKSGVQALESSPAYDAAYHAPTVGTLARACESLRSAVMALGTPTDSADWRSVVEQAVAALESVIQDGEEAAR